MTCLKFRGCLKLGNLQVEPTARRLHFPRSIGGFSGGNFRITFERGRGGPERPIDLRFPTNRSIGIIVGNLDCPARKSWVFQAKNVWDYTYG